MARPNTFVDLDGRLALQGYSTRDKERPVEVTVYHVFTQHPADGCEKYLLGCQVGNWDGNRGSMQTAAGEYRIVDVTGCPRVTREVPVPKPRDGKTHTWRWASYVWGEHGPGWERVEFPECPYCGKYHNPEWIQCDACDTCHREGSRCKARECWTCGREFIPLAESLATRYYCPTCRPVAAEAK